MFFFIILLVICICCSVLSFFCGISIRYSSFEAVYVFFCIAFAVLSGLILFKIVPWHKESPSSAEDYDAVTTAMLSYYVPQGSAESESYFLEITEDDHYKFCYFELDGSTITRAQIPAYDDNVEIIASNDDLPHRVEFCAKGDKIVAIKLHIPDDANTIQFDLDGK